MLPVACNCVTGDTTTLDVAGAGSAASPFTLTPIVDPAAGNIISCGPAGLLAEYPARVLSKPRAKVTKTDDDSVVAADTAINWDTVVYDTDGWFNLAQPTRLTNPLGRAVCVTVGCCINLDFLSNTDDWRIRFRRSVGAQGIAGRTRRSENTTTSDTMTLETDILLASGEYVECLLRHTSATNETIKRLYPGAPTFWISYNGD